MGRKSWPPPGVQPAPLTREQQDAVDNLPPRYRPKGKKIFEALQFPHLFSLVPPERACVECRASRNKWPCVIYLGGRQWACFSCGGCGCSFRTKQVNEDLRDEAKSRLGVLGRSGHGVPSVPGRGWSLTTTPETVLAELADEPHWHDLHPRPRDHSEDWLSIGRKRSFDSMTDESNFKRDDQSFGLGPPFFLPSIGYERWPRHAPVAPLSTNHIHNAHTPRSIKPPPARSPRSLKHPAPQTDDLLINNLVTKFWAWSPEPL